MQQQPTAQEADIYLVCGRGVVEIAGGPLWHSVQQFVVACCAYSREWAFQSVGKLEPSLPAGGRGRGKVWAGLCKTQHACAHQLLASSAALKVDAADARRAGAHAW